MIAFVTHTPIVSPYHGHVLVTATSGGDLIRLLLTRHAAFHLGRKCQASFNELLLDECNQGEKVVGFPKTGTRRRRRRKDK